MHARWRRILEFTLGRWRATRSVVTAEAWPANLRESASKPTRIEKQTYEKPSANLRDIDYARAMSALLTRHLLPFARETIGVFPAVVIQGARQVGKSTFAGMLTQGLAAEHFTFDDAATRDAVRADPDAFVAQFPGKALVLEEIQRVPEIVLPIKAAIDRDRRPG